MGSLREINLSKHNDNYDQEIKNFVDSLDNVIRCCGEYPTQDYLKQLETEFDRVLTYLSKRPYRVRRGCYDAIILRELSLKRLGFIVEDNILGFSEKRQEVKLLWIEESKHRGWRFNWKED
jgi:hypothetical protein